MLQYNIQATLLDRVLSGAQLFPPGCSPWVAPAFPNNEQACGPMEIKRRRALGPKSVLAGGKTELIDDIEHVNNNLITQTSSEGIFFKACWCQQYSDTEEEMKAVSCQNTSTLFCSATDFCVFIKCSISHTCKSCHLAVCHKSCHLGVRQSAAFGELNRSFKESWIQIYQPHTLPGMVRIKGINTGVKWDTNIKFNVQSFRKQIERTRLDWTEGFHRVGQWAVHAEMGLWLKSISLRCHPRDGQQEQI